ncbi:MAG TPA: DUF2635 domain-containing protein [Sphingobium sp.]|uniref:DUF2635 domain-containing protein n=1 Tax=Sphingobium sp. TaxID=1912891 RepID=UPI002ED11BBF
MMIYSVPGRLVRDPATRRLVTADGLEVDHTDPVWHRLLQDGDVSDEPPAQVEPTDAAPASVGDHAE